ncbi:clumping factor A [Teleopsis dalmanni]|uniref:clumping factor A n=1 Tax=Teleopsis dalmanni TaxID=139649 RepID=UPI0018CD39B6|nr:clumping factor A [Teleopsis dalmanni]
MSNSLFMDETNGNGVFASKSQNTNNPTVISNGSNIAYNINNIMHATSNPNPTTSNSATLPTSVSNEDLSQSLSEYTDADESISAPTEFLAEFLSAVMLKDYKKALKYCKLILQYEPNNATAKEFYPLILDKLHIGTTSSDSDENYNKSTSPEIHSTGDSDEAAAYDDQQSNGIVDAVADDYGAQEDFSGEEQNSNVSNISNDGSSRNSSNCASLEEECLSDDEEVEADEEDEDEDDDNVSSSGDDGGGGSAGNVSNSSGNSGGDGRSRSDNTTHSYSSLLLEEEDDIAPINLQFNKDLTTPDLDVSNGNKILSASCSDSESPTEPLTQRLAAILLSKCGVSNNGENY